MQLDNNKLTVMQLVPALDAGGVEQGTVEVSEALCMRGYRSVVVSNGGRLVDRITSHGGKHVKLPIHQKSLKTLMCVGRLRKLIVEHRPDVLHARSRIPAWIGRLALRRALACAHPCWVTTVHGLYSVNSYSRVMTSGQLVEVVSETARDYVLKHYPKTDPDKLFLNYRGVDPDAFSYGYVPSDTWIKSWTEQYPMLQGRFTVALVGRLTRLKGHHDLIDTIVRLRQRGIDAHGLIVGGEDPRRLSYAKELHDAVRDKQLADYVTFTGHRSDIKDVLAVSSAVVSLSTKPESFGRSTLEAIRIGRPVIGYDHGGVGEVLRATYPAGLVPLSNLGNLTDRLAEIARGEVQLPESSKHFLLSDMLDRSMEIYKRCAEMTIH